MNEQTAVASAITKLDTWFQSLSPAEQAVIAELLRGAIEHGDVMAYGASPILLALARTTLAAVVLSGAAAVPGRTLASGAGLAGPVVTAATSMSSDTEMRLAQAINEQRAANGLAPLAVDPQLTDLARARSQDQVSRHYFSHTTPDGQTIFDLLDQRQINFNAAGENLAESRGVDPVQAAIDGFLQSQAHRDNLLSPNYARVGVGAATGDDGTTVLTVVFLK